MCRLEATHNDWEMERIVENIGNRQTNIYGMLKDVQFTETERWRVEGYASRAEAFVDLVLALVRGIRALGHAIDRTSRLPARTAH